MRLEDEDETDASLARERGGDLAGEPCNVPGSAIGEGRRSGMVRSLQLECPQSSLTHQDDKDCAGRYFLGGQRPAP